LSDTACGRTFAGLPPGLHGGGGGRFGANTRPDGPEIVPGRDTGVDVLDGDGNVVASTNPGDCPQMEADQ
jgi:hypothetical protein